MMPQEAGQKAVEQHLVSQLGLSGLIIAKNAGTIAELEGKLAETQELLAAANKKLEEPPPALKAIK